MTGFTFANPHYIHLLWVVFLIGAFLVVTLVRGSSRLEQFLSREMQDRLLRSISLRRRFIAVGFCILAMLFFVVTLMRPQWGGQTIQADTVSSQVMICLDVSKSMLAEDVVPNRLDRAKAEIDALLGLMRDGQQVGLIAFAGKATVLCPQTTDFGFVRLILKEASPSSVGLGGTKLGDAIRAATEGFGAAGDINRLMLVITDGEDHESFPLDAAAAAAEKGIRIVTVGFGDEAGSTIEITNPDTGRPELLRDRDDNPVVSRLDGTTLREIALRTQGAYIPAGTGALDLESIYNAHIKSMLSGVKGEGTVTIRNEAFQWPLACGLVCWLFAVRLTAPRVLPEATARSARRSKSVTAALLLAICNVGLHSSNAAAQSSTFPGSAPGSLPAADTLEDEDAQPDAGKSESAAPDSSEPGNASEMDEQLLLSPREMYNLAMASLADDEKAESLLNGARGRAGVDGEVRFRALYNLGWIEARRAENLVDEQPKEALKHLNLAAGRFREAIRIRPESNEARRNLEVVSLRILAIEDELNRQDPSDLSARLDKLIEESGSITGELMVMSQTQSLYPDESDRAAFRRLRGKQRILITEISRLAEDTSREVSRLESEKDVQQPDAPDPAIQGAQLRAMLRYVEQALPWANKSRSFARRLSAQPSFLRWNSSTNYIKRAREQLREPVDRLKLLVGDVSEHAQLTELKASAMVDAISVNDDEPVDELRQERRVAPAWLDQEFLRETAASYEERTAELAQLFEAISSTEPQSGSNSASNSSSTNGGASPGEQDSSDDAGQEVLRAKFAKALPLVNDAKGELSECQVALDSSDYQRALAADIEVVVMLGEALEYFLDVKRLIEVTLADQMQLQAQLLQLQEMEKNPADFFGPEAKGLPPEISKRVVELLKELQSKNLKRIERLQGEILAEAEQQSASSTQPGQAGSEVGDSPEALQQRTEVAIQLCKIAATEMEQLLASLDVEPSELPKESNKKFDGELAEVTSDDDSIGSEEIDKESETDEANDEGEMPSESPADGTSVDSPGAENAGVDAKRPETLVEESRFFVAAGHGESAIERLKELQRLYFSLIEHLRDTAQRQQVLNEETSSQAARNELQPGPLGFRQENLQELTTALAEQFAEAGESAGSPDASAADPLAQGGSGLSPSPTAPAIPGAADPGEADPAASQQQEAMKFKQASELIRSAATDQGTAVENLQILSEQTATNAGTSEIDTAKPQTEPPNADSANTDSSNENQTTAAQESDDQDSDDADSETPLESVKLAQEQALENLLKALQLFDDQQDQDQDGEDNEEQNGGDDQQQENQQENQGDQGQGTEDEQNQQQRNMTAEQLLQAIRDAEAQRRDGKKVRAVGSGIVEKDW